jgi:hypothetical protein
VRSVEEPPRRTQSCFCKRRLRKFIRGTPKESNYGRFVVNFVMMMRTALVGTFLYTPVALLSSQRSLGDAITTGSDGEGGMTITIPLDSQLLQMLQTEQKESGKKSFDFTGGIDDAGAVVTIKLASQFLQEAVEQAMYIFPMLHQDNIKFDADSRITFK